MRLAGKVAIITGGGSGIGLGIGRGFAREGARLVVGGRDEAKLARAQVELAGLGAEVLAQRVDVSQPADVEALVEAAVSAFGRVDILVNSAGIPMVAPSEELTMDQWREVQEINLTGTFLCCQSAGRLMLRQGSGSIINIGSMTSFVGIPRRLGYATTKAAVVELTKTLAVEWGPQGVRVNAIAPGWIHTPIVERLSRQGILNTDAIVARTPMRRLGTIDDMAGPAIFLASDDAVFVNGHTLVVDGGYLAYGFV